MGAIARWGMILLMFLTLLPACGGGGGGGGGSSSSSTTTASQPDTVVSGVASKGPIKNGLVKVYAVGSNESTGELLAEGGTDSEGQFSVNLGPYVGAILVEASGSYVDEATGLEASVSGDLPLRAALEYAEGDVWVAVTALTELATRQAEAAGFSVDEIGAANVLVSDQFHFSIIDVQPVDPSAEVLEDVPEAVAQYTLALAGVSQMIEDGSESLTELLGNLADELAVNSHLPWPYLDAFDAGIANFLDNANNRTGVFTPEGAGLESVGRTRGRVLLNVENLPEGVLLGSLDVSIVFPVGVRLSSDAEGVLDEGAVVALGDASDSIMAANYLPETADEFPALNIALADIGGFGVGGVVRIEFEVPGNLLPAAETIGITLNAATDGLAAPVDGVVVEVVVEAVPQT